MKSISVEQKVYLSKLKLEELKEKCIEDIKSMELDAEGYPAEPEKYRAFVEDCYKKATENYHLETEQEIKALLLAGHIGGKAFTENQDITKYLTDKTASGYDKLMFLQTYIESQLENMENNNGGV